MEFIGNYESGNFCRCGKKCYTKADANAWLNNLRKGHCTTSHIGKGSNVPKRAYHCDICNYWHLTHFKKEKVKPGKSKPAQKREWDDYDRMKGLIGKDLSSIDW